jgi:hypothetical protein
MIVIPADAADTVFGLFEAVRSVFVRVDAIGESSISLATGDGRAHSAGRLGFPIRSTPALGSPGKVPASPESSGMVTRQRGTEDRRAVCVRGAEEAKALLDQVLDRVLTEVVLPTTANFYEKSIVALHKLADRLNPPEFVRASLLL